jgi:antitoxin component YwqK of YwqJK toxin-antitoxin module
MFVQVRFSAFFRSLWRINLVLGCLFASTIGLAQEVSEDSLMREDDPEALIMAELEQAKKRKSTEKTPVKQPKNVFYGTKIKKNFIKQFTTNGTEIEIFYYVLDPQEPNPYLKNVQEVVWYNPHKRALQKTLDADKEDFRLLHGPYKKVRNGKVIAEGYYFMGTKHGRWESYDDNYVLKDKTKYYHGWPKEAQITYYDSDRKKIKEVIPIHYGEKNGMYYAFYEGGQLQARGRYEHDHPIGTWFEYYQFGKYSQMKKKETKYPRRPFDKTEPMVVREWDDKGKVVFDMEKDGPKTNDQKEKSTEKIAKDKTSEDDSDEKF